MCRGGGNDRGQLATGIKVLFVSSQRWRKERKDRVGWCPPRKQRKPHIMLVCRTSFSSIERSAPSRGGGGALPTLPVLPADGR
jgi:hypothetical protein